MADEKVKQSEAQSALAEHLTKKFEAMSRERWAEEREWAQAGYFDQLKQWLDEDPQTKRLRPMKARADQKWPMPVTNHFSKTISANANSLGAGIPEMLALSDNYDSRNRRAAEAAGNAIDAANRESGMEILNPTLARQVVLWGTGCVEDSIAFDSTVEVPQVEEPQDPNQPQDPSQPQGQPQLDPDADADNAPNVVGTVNVPTPRLKSELISVFQFMLPRDAQDPNLAKEISYWKQIPVGELREMYPDYGDSFKSDDGPNQTHSAYYMNSLRSLSYQNRSNQEAKGETCTVYIYWGDWTKLPKEVQEKIQAEWEGQPSEAYEKDGLDKLSASIQYGLYVVLYDKKVIEWGENPWQGDKPLTFFPWQKDALSVYPKGLSTELVPLQKQLNRVDSLMERALMSNGTVKLLWPTTQSSVKPPDGDPVEVTYWDPLGEGKVKPEYFSGHAYGGELIKKREQIVADFKELGFTNSVAEGEMPGSGTAFRALAYLGAKAEETRKTQRYLWEQAHEIRARKIIKMAQKVWDEPRKVQTAGFNNRYGAQQLEGADLQGSYQLSVIQDSSRPKTMTEKLEALGMLTQGGFVNPQDRATKEYVLDTLGETELDMADHLMYVKAERDLQKLIAGVQPMESPFEKWDIPLELIANFSFTEEFEALPDQTRNGILMYAQYISDKLTMAKGGGMPPMPGGPAPGGDPTAAAANMQATKGGPGGQPASHVLGQTPGTQVSPQQVQMASIREGAGVVPNSAQPSA
jgi:hypothetical protein